MGTLEIEYSYMTLCEAPSTSILHCHAPDLLTSCEQATGFRPLVNRAETRDLLNILDTMAKAGADFHSLGDAWAGTTTGYGRLMLTVLGRLGRVRARIDPRQDAR
jgi:hypothetical protein